MLLGHKEAKDYAGAKTLYVFNALQQAGVDCEVYDIGSDTDTPTGCTHSVWLPWINQLDKGWVDFVASLGTKNIIYMENYHWWGDRRKFFLQEKELDLEYWFQVALASNEDIRWWPAGRCMYWGAVVDEDVALPRPPEDYLYVDEIWPKEWADGPYSAAAVLDIAIPRIKEQTGLMVVSQKTEAPWVDKRVPERCDVEEMLGVLGGARVYLTTHEEALGLMQIEALMCGVPVVSNPNFSKNEVRKMDMDGVWWWNWDTFEPEDEFDLDPEKTANYMCEAVMTALEKANREEIRAAAIGHYGKAAFVKRTGATLV